LSTATRVVERSMQNPGAMIVYAKGAGDNTPYFRRWDGTQWGLLDRQATPVGAGNTIQYLVLKFARTRNEAILGTLDSSGEIRVQVWNGNTNTWSATTLLADVGAASDLGYRSFDIEYETSGDRAIVVYKDANGSGDPDYRIWDGTSWSAATNIIIPSAGEVRWIELAPHPWSSEIVMITLNSGGTPDVYGMRWDGVAWTQMEVGPPTTWDTAAANSGNPADTPSKVIDVAYEQLSGRAMFIWGDDVNGRQSYRIWDGAALSAPANLDLTGAFIPGPDMNGQADWVRLVARPNSNDLMYGVQDENLDLFTARWTGATPWVSPIRHDASTEDIDDRNFDIVFETNPAFAGQAWLVWGNGGNTSRKQWDGAAWGAATNFGDDAALVQLAAHPRSGVIFTGIYQSTGSATDDITALQNVGGAWSAETIIWNGATPSNLYERVFIATERFFPIINWKEVY